MHQPSLNSEIGKGGEICLEEILELSLLLGVIEDMVGKTSVVMWVEDGLVKVFLTGVPSPAAHILLLLPPDREEVGVSFLEIHSETRSEQHAQREY